MHWESFYVPPDRVEGQDVRFSKEETHHLKVLRKKIGDRVWTVDGEGSAHDVELTLLRGTEAEGRIIKTRRRTGEPLAEISLGQAVLKGDRFDWLVEKATEIGVRRIIPVHTAYTAVSTGPQKISRWKRIALQAMKQCGRSILPEICEEREFSQVLSLGSTCHFRLIAEIGRGATRLSIDHDGTPPMHTPRGLLLVGPESGFAEQETEAAMEHGFRPVSLGPRRLKAETAGIVLLTQVLSMLTELE